MSETQPKAWAHDVDLQLDVLIERRYRERLKKG
jgi:hypothetical protein